MAKSTGFENHRLRTLIWIVRKLQRRPMSLSELNEEWLDDTDISAGKEMERRSFNNHLRAILDLFGINIECNRRHEYKYRITSTEITPVARLMMDNFEQNLALGNATKLEGRVLVDKAPCGIEFLEKIMEAMEKSHQITIGFKHFIAEKPFTVTGSPYCVKLYQQRWYVVLLDDEGFIDSYSLDRITHVRMERSKFVMDPEFDSEEFFKYSFGVRVSDEHEPDIIKLKVAAVQRGYFRTLPLHHSQREIETHEEYSIFTIEVVPTVELIMKIFSYGYLVEVLEPAYYRELVKEELLKTYDMYFTTNDNQNNSL